MSEFHDWREYAICKGREDEYDAQRLPKPTLLREQKAHALCRACPVLRECGLDALSGEVPYEMVRAGFAFGLSEQGRVNVGTKLAARLGVSPPERAKPTRGAARFALADRLTMIERMSARGFSIRDIADHLSITDRQVHRDLQRVAS